jgi:REP element-mobilizing transposase RayT
VSKRSSKVQHCVCNWIFERKECGANPPIFAKKQTKGKHFWSRGYCVSTVGLDEETIRKYIREQEEAEKEQLDFDFE